jgi:LuxR family maltose regulon positive regulatory protein
MPPAWLRQHRLRMSGQLCEIRDRDLYFSLAESHDLLANFGVQLADADLALLHRQSEGWPAVMQMAALSLRGTTDTAGAGAGVPRPGHRRLLRLRGSRAAVT